MEDVDRPGGLPRNAEENVAARIKMEREARGWSTATVAERLAEVGHPINQSAVWRIESGEPRRRINLDEAIGFAKVFDITLDSLIGPPEVAANEHLAKLLKDFVDAWRVHMAAEDLMKRARAVIDTYADKNPNQRELVDALLMRAMTQAEGQRFRRTPQFTNEEFERLTYERLGTTNPVHPAPSEPIDEPE